MEDSIQRINQIMQYYYDKQKENEELFAMPGKEKKALEDKIYDLESKRNQQKINLLRDLEGLKDEKQTEIDEYINNYSLSQNNNQNNYYSKDQIDRIYNSYQAEIDKLTSKLNEINEKEQKLKQINLQIREIQLNKQSMLQNYINKRVVGNDPTMASVVKVNFEKEYKDLVNQLISKIVELTGEIEQKSYLETQLKNLKDSMKKENAYLRPEESNMRIFDSTVNLEKQKLEQEYSKIEQDLNKKITALEPRTEEEINLIKELDELSKKPNYNKVYLREMFELKVELSKKISEERAVIESILKRVQSDYEKINNEINLKKQEKQKTFDDKNKEYSDVKRQINEFEYENADSSRIEKQQELVKMSMVILEELSKIEKQEVATPEQLSELKILESKIAELQAFLQKIEEYSNLLVVSAEESNAYASKMEPYEQEEYYRRKLAGKDNKIELPENKNIIDKEYNKIELSENEFVTDKELLSDKSESNVEQKEEVLSDNIDISDKIEEPVEEEIIEIVEQQPPVVEEVSSTNLKDNEILELYTVEPNTTIIQNINYKLDNADYDKEVTDTIENIETSKAVKPEETSDVEETTEIVEEKPEKIEEINSNVNLEKDNLINGMYNNPQDIPNDFEDKHYVLNIGNTKFSDDKIVSDTFDDLSKAIYLDIVTRINELNAIKLDGSKSEENKDYISSRKDQNKYTFDGKVSKDRMELLYGEYINADDIVDAIENYYEKNKGKEYVVVEENKSYSISESRMKKIDKEIKECCLLVLKKNESNTAIYGKDDNMRSANLIGNMDINLPDGYYVNREQLIILLSDLLVKSKGEKTEWMKNLVNNLQGTTNMNSEFNDQKINRK